MIDIREALHITLDSPYFDEAYAKALSEEEVPFFLTEEFIRELDDKCHVLPQTREKALEALPHVASVPELCLLAKTIYHILDTREKYSRAFSAISFPEAPADCAHAIGYECFAFFPILAHIKKSWEELLARGVGEQVATDSVRWMDSFFAEACKTYGKICFPKEYFAAYGVGIYVDSLIIGRLRFEICGSAKLPVRILKSTEGEYLPLMDEVAIHPSGHILGTYGCEESEEAYPADFRETEEAYEGYTVDPVTRLVRRERLSFPKDRWTQVYAKGAPVIKVHIPSGGGMTPELCADSYTRAKEIFTRCYPEYRFQCYLIGCWMLSPLLKEILPPASNIVAFADGFTVFPIENDARDAFLYVYGIKGKRIPEIDVAALPEGNTLQRGIKQKACEGKLVYQFGGFRPW